MGNLHTVCVAHVWNFARVQRNSFTEDTFCRSFFHSDVSLLVINKFIHRLVKSRRKRKRKGNNKEILYGLGIRLIISKNSPRRQAHFLSRGNIKLQVEEICRRR